MEEGILYITCKPMFQADVTWANRRDSQDGGYGNASINDTFNKTVPLKIHTSKQTLKKGERGEITLAIPVTDLDVQKPTTMYTQLVAYINGDEENQITIRVNFTISW